MTTTLDPSTMSIDELIAAGYSPANPVPQYAELVAAGQPTVTFEIPGLHSGVCVLLSTNLDGSRWVLLWHGATLLVESRWCTAPTRPGYRDTDPATARAAFQAIAPGVSAGQLKVLIALRDAGDYGMLDHDHQQVNGLEQDSAGKRRLELQRKGLVIAKTGFTRSTPRGPSAQVWVITDAGQQALRPSRPPSLAHLHTRPLAG